MGQGNAEIRIARGGQNRLDGQRPSARQSGSPRLQEMAVGLSAPDLRTKDSVAFRRARSADLGMAVALLADDPLGRERENPGTQLHTCYSDAFAAIDRDPNQLLAVAERGGQ